MRKKKRKKDENKKRKNSEFLFLFVLCSFKPQTNIFYQDINFQQTFMPKYGNWAKWDTTASSNEEAKQLSRTSGRGSFCEFGFPKERKAKNPNWSTQEVIRSHTTLLLMVVCFQVINQPISIGNKYNPPPNYSYCCYFYFKGCWFQPLIFKAWLKHNYEQFVGAVQLGHLRRGNVERRQAHAFADLVTQMRVEEQGHASHTWNTGVIRLKLFKHLLI